VSVVTKPMYAVCEFEDSSTIELAQLPGHPIYVRGNLPGDSEGESNTITIY